MRTLGVDTPEVKDPRKPIQCGGPEASQFARDTLLGQPVRLVGDPTQDQVDRYGRSLFYVELPDATDYSTLVAENGWAHAYIYNPKRVPQRIGQIRAAEGQARAAGRGIWSLCPVTT